jgi:hypothetical protein
MEPREPKEYKEDKMHEQYRARLKKIIGKKFDTTMIYPLSQIEAAFGHLWGHGKPDSSLSNEEIMYKRKWDECRTNILNNGNQQKRNAYTELDMHDVEWKRFTATLKPVNVA